MWYGLESQGWLRGRLAGRISLPQSASVLILSLRIEQKIMPPYVLEVEGPALPHPSFDTGTNVRLGAASLGLSSRRGCTLLLLGDFLFLSGLRATGICTVGGTKDVTRCLAGLSAGGL